MQVAINPELAKFVDDQIRSGRFATTDEAVNAGLARLQTDTELSEVDIDDLRIDLDVGIAEADRGEFVEFTAEDVIAERKAARKRKS